MQIQTIAGSYDEFLEALAFKESSGNLGSIGGANKTYLIVIKAVEIMDLLSLSKPDKRNSRTYYGKSICSFS